jgi:MFS family permease
VFVQTPRKRGSAPQRPTPQADRERSRSGGRLVLLAVAGLLTAAAALAIGILLFGDFGSTEGRILATTALLAGYALSALPAAMLRDRRRGALLFAAVVALAAAAASLTTTAVWSEEPPEELGNAIGTANAWLVAAVQAAALTLRRSERDSRVVRLLFAASSALAVVLALMLTTLVWAEIDSERYGRALGALLVLDVLLVALQPILARVRPRTVVHRLRVAVAAGDPIDLTVEAPDLAAAALQAIRTAERDGHRVLGLAFTEDVTPAPQEPVRAS